MDKHERGPYKEQAASPKVSVILPCRDEEETLGFCLSSIKEVLTKHDIDAEIIVSDSSKDRSPQIAKEAGAVLIKHDKEGYGAACREGFKAARGRHIFIADADGTYDFNEMPAFLRCLDDGSDFVVGDRFLGGIEKGAMQWHRRYIGNPILSSLLSSFFGTRLHDVHCGMRAIRKESLDSLSLETEGMEFASEMVIQAKKKNLRTKELPIRYYGRRGRSKLRAFPDGLRHIRLIIRSIMRGR